MLTCLHQLAYNTEFFEQHTSKRVCGMIRELKAGDLTRVLI
jgi:hypothetical protein